jgi:hypothetical protein
MIRYRCPTCPNGGRLAPASMHPDDIRRFCIECSIKTGKLVRVVSVKREAELAARDQKRQRAAEKEAKRMARKGAAILEQRERVRLRDRTWPHCLAKRWTTLNKQAGGPTQGLDTKKYVLSDRVDTYLILLKHAANVAIDPGTGSGTEQRRHDAVRKLLRDQAEKRGLMRPIIPLDPAAGRLVIDRYVRTHLAPVLLCEDYGVPVESEHGQAICGAAQAGAWRDCDQLAAEANILLDAAALKREAEKIAAGDFKPEPTE